MGRQSKGRGTIYQREDGYWIGQITTGRNEFGKQIRKTFSAKSEAEVVAKINEYQYKQDKGDLVDSNTIKLGEWIQEWLKEYKGNLRQTTRENYDNMIQTHILTHSISKIQIQKLSTSHIQKFMNEKSKEKRIIIKENKKTTSNENISPRTVNLLHFLISSSLEQAIRNELITKNPAKYCKKLANEKKEIKALTTEQVIALLETAQKHELYPALVIALHTGLRRGEVLGLTWENINFDEDTMNITQSLVKIKGGTKLQEPKTKSSKRILPMTDTVIELLSINKQKTGLIFQTRNNQPVHPRSFQRTFSTWCKNAGLPKETRLHDLRHTFATNIINAGIDIKTAQSLTGHADTRTLLDIYAHTVTASQRNAANIINGLIPKV